MGLLWVLPLALAAVPISADEDRAVRQALETVLRLEFALRESSAHLLMYQDASIGLTTPSATRLAYELLPLIDAVRPLSGDERPSRDQPTLNESWRRLMGLFEFDPAQGWPQPAKRPVEQLGRGLLGSTLGVYSLLIDVGQREKPARVRDDQLTVKLKKLASSAQLTRSGEDIEATFGSEHGPFLTRRQSQYHWAVELPPGPFLGAGFKPRLTLYKRLEWEGKWPERAGESADQRAARIAVARALRGEWAFTLGAPRYVAELADVQTDAAVAATITEFSMLLGGEASLGRDPAERARLGKELSTIAASGKSGRALLRDYVEAYRHHLEHSPEKRANLAGGAEAAELLGLRVALGARLTAMGPDVFRVESDKNEFKAKEAVRERGEWHVQNVPRGSSPVVAPAPTPTPTPSNEPGKTVYTYEDAQGQQHFVDDLSQVPERYRARAKPFR